MSRRWGLPAAAIAAFVLLALALMGQSRIGSGFSLPSQSGNALKLLQTNGTTPLWVDAAVILDRVSANTTVANTAGETTFYTKSIPGATLGTNVRLRLTLQCQAQTDVVTGTVITIRLKYGATTLATIANGFTSDGITGLPPSTAVLFEFWLSGDGATNAQLGHIRVTHESSSVTLTNAVDQVRQARGTAAIDSTVAQTLVVTVQWAGASATNTITMEHAILEQL